MRNAGSASLIVCLLSVGACASGADKTQEPSVAKASATLASSTAPVSDLMQDGTSWVFDAPPSPPPPGIVSADMALHSATSAVRGGFLAENPSAIERLVTFTDATPLWQTDKSPRYTGLVWVVQITGVKIGVPTPQETSKPVTTMSTVQWIIDAKTGKYVEARDWGSRVS